MKIIIKNKTGKSLQGKTVTVKTKKGLIDKLKRRFKRSRLA